MHAMTLRRDANSENVTGAREPSLFLSKKKYFAPCQTLFTLIWPSIPSHTSRAVKLSRKSGIWN